MRRKQGSPRKTLNKDSAYFAHRNESCSCAYLVYEALLKLANRNRLPEIPEAGCLSFDRTNYRQAVWYGTTTKRIMGHVAGWTKQQQKDYLSEVTDRRFTYIPALGCADGLIEAIADRIRKASTSATEHQRRDTFILSYRPASTDRTKQNPCFGFTLP